MNVHTKRILTEAKNEAGQNMTAEFRNTIAQMLAENTGAVSNRVIELRIAVVAIAYKEKMELIEKNYHATLDYLGQVELSEQVVKGLKKR